MAAFCDTCMELRQQTLAHTHAHSCPCVISMHICMYVTCCIFARLHVNHRLPVSLELSATTITIAIAVIGATNHRHLSASALHSTHTLTYTYKHTIKYMCVACPLASASNKPSLTAFVRLNIHPFVYLY